jgi:hypothetical protein
MGGLIVVAEVVSLLDHILPEILVSAFSLDDSSVFLSTIFLFFVIMFHQIIRATPATAG